MKKAVILFLLLIGLTIAPPVRASDITENIEISLTPTPTADLKPPPTPEPENTKPKEEKPKDTRTWTKFIYKDIIASVAEKYKLDPQLIYATIMTESEGNVFAYRYEPQIDDASLCMGQILIGTARSLGFEGNPDDMYKPEVCIDLIGRYHRQMLDKYGDLTPEQLTIAYNTGSPWKVPVYGHLSRFNKWYHEQG